MNWFSSFLKTVLGWLPLVTQGISLAAPIVEANAGGKGAQIASAVNAAATIIAHSASLSGVPEDPSAAQIGGVLAVAAPITEGIISQFTTASGHTVTTTVTPPTSK